MPDEYIKRDAVLDYLTIMPIDIGFSDIDRVIDFVKELPAADVVPVKRGRWIEGGDVLPCLTCSECKESVLGTAFTKYCPNCGARLEEGNDES